MRYLHYKPTGIPWLPEIPEGWEISRLKWILNEIKNLSTTGEELPLSLTASNGLIPFSEKANRTMESASYVGAKIVEQGQIVFNRFKARLFAVAPCRGLVSSDYAVYSTKTDVEKQYLLALFAIPQFRQAMNNQASGIGDGFSRLYSSELFKLYIPVPPLAEQRAIVAFLDGKCGKLNRLVVAKEKEVALLKELKQSMIAEAVTRGVRKNRRLVPSGIPWLPEVPEGWEVRRAKYLFRKEQRPILVGDEIVTCFRDGEVTLRKNRRLSGFTEATDYSHYQHICAGDLVIHQMDAFAGSCGVSDSEGMGTPVLSVCTPKSNQLDVRYFAAVVRLMGLNGFIQSLYRGIRERSSDFRFETFAKQMLPVPPLAEQREIVAYIEARAAKIDAAVAGLEKEIAALKEYKQRLIADVVTGQRRVA